MSNTDLFYHACLHSVCSLCHVGSTSRTKKCVAVFCSEVSEVRPKITAGGVATESHECGWGSWSLDVCRSTFSETTAEPQRVQLHLTVQRTQLKTRHNHVAVKVPNLKGEAAGGQIPEIGRPFAGWIRCFLSIYRFYFITSNQQTMICWVGIPSFENFWPSTTFSQHTSSYVRVSVYKFLNIRHKHVAEHMSSREATSCCAHGEQICGVKKKKRREPVTHPACAEKEWGGFVTQRGQYSDKTQKDGWLERCNVRRYRKAGGLIQEALCHSNN